MNKEMGKHVKHFILVFWAFIGPTLSIMAQTKNIPDSAQYSALLMFQSVCCGVPDQEPLDKSIRAFIKKEKLASVRAWKIGPMGREGEYYLVFDLRKWPDSRRNAFINILRNVSDQLKDPGHVSFEENYMIQKVDLPGRATMEPISW
ncbi:MAG TPA: hypothetical protein DCQ34_03080 [Chitinophagaceae bacterium]|nr:hypothetical protein [Chitinophagaceae bacterium]